MKIFFLISVGLFLLYYIGNWIVFGLRDTISHWFYSIKKYGEKQGKNLTWVTPLVFANMAWPLAFISNFDTFVSIGCGFIFLVGVLPYFIKANIPGAKLQTYLHVIFAGGSSVFIFLPFIFYGLWYISLIVIVGSLLLQWKKPKRYGNLIETLAFVGAFVGIYLYYI